jgi:hypothetical protein
MITRAAAALTGACLAAALIAAPDADACSCASVKIRQAFRQNDAAIIGKLRDVRPIESAGPERRGEGPRRVRAAELHLPSSQRLQGRAPDRGRNPDRRPQLGQRGLLRATPSAHPNRGLPQSKAAPLDLEPVLDRPSAEDAQGGGAAGWWSRRRFEFPARTRRANERTGGPARMLALSSRIPRIRRHSACARPNQIGKGGGSAAPGARRPG